MICDTARRANNYVGGWMTRQPEIHEESITDWLLDFFDQHTNQLRYYKFNQYEESQSSGADWDWWIILRNGCFKLRIQAKRIKSGENHYNSITHSNQNGYQIDMLLNSSANLNFYPLYSLYGRGEGVERCQRQQTQTYLHICSAQEVYDLVFVGGPGRINSSDLLGLSIPMECLFCCPLVRNESDPRNLFEHYFRPPGYDAGGDDQEDSENIVPGYEEEVPSIINALFEMETYNENSKGFLQKYRDGYPGSNSISILKVNEKLYSFKKSIKIDQV